MAKELPDNRNSQGHFCEFVDRNRWGYFRWYDYSTKQMYFS